jgi:hypothetical protein
MFIAAVSHRYERGAELQTARRGYKGCSFATIVDYAGDLGLQP